jgi:hypothetical protein
MYLWYNIENETTRLTAARLNRSVSRTFDGLTDTQKPVRPGCIKLRYSDVWGENKAVGAAEIL